MNYLSNPNENYISLDNETLICRICFEVETPQNKLIAPCKCTGHSRFVHEECLKKWRFSNLINSEARHSCMECCHRYNISYQNKTRPMVFQCLRVLNSSFCCNIFLVWAMIDSIGLSLCSSESYNNFFKNNLNLNIIKLQDQCLILPYLLFIMGSSLAHLRAANRIHTDNLLPVRKHIIKTAVIFSILVCLFATYSFIGYLFFNTYLYFKYLKSGIDNYAESVEILQEYNHQELQVINTNFNNDIENQQEESNQNSDQPRSFNRIIDNDNRVPTLSNDNSLTPQVSNDMEPQVSNDMEPQVSNDSSETESDEHNSDNIYYADSPTNHEQPILSNH